MTARSFRAILERRPGRLGWVMVRIPFDVRKAWGQRGQVRVRGDINGFAFRTSLFPDGNGRHSLLVNKQMQRAAGVRAGMAARFRLEQDHEERVAPMPAELAGLLRQERALGRWYAALTYSVRKEIGDWIAAPKSPAVRVRRAERLGERLLATMEAERELPPLIRRALAEHPQAQRGWLQMSASRRRGHLLSIFYYRTPEGQARRIAKAIEDAESVAARGER